MKRILFPALAACSFAITPIDANARRVHVMDSTDPATKAYCKANPDKCETRINWGSSIGYTVGIFVFMALLASGSKIIWGLLKTGAKKLVE